MKNFHQKESPCVICLFADLESLREHFKTKSHTFSLFKGRTYKAMLSNHVYFFRYNGQMYRLTRTYNGNVFLLQGNWMQDN